MSMCSIARASWCRMGYILQLQGGVHDYAGKGQAENDAVDEEKHHRLEQRAAPAAPEYPPHCKESVNGRIPAQYGFESIRHSRQFRPRGRGDDGANHDDRHRKVESMQVNKKQQVLRIAVARAPIQQHMQEGDQRKKNKHGLGAVCTTTGKSALPLSRTTSRHACWNRWSHFGSCVNMMKLASWQPVTGGALDAAAGAAASSN